MKTLFERVSKYIEDFGKVSAFVFLLLVIIVSGYFCFGLSAPKKLQVTFFDVGQGDAIFIETPSGKQMLVDGGASAIVLERLAKEMSYFDRTIDVVVATHGDADHVTGLIPVLRAYDTSLIVESPIKGESGIFEELRHEIKKKEVSGALTHIASRGDVIDLGDGVTAEILYPGKDISPRTETNDASVSLVLTYGEHSFLLTGDLSSSYEHTLISKTIPKKITVYKAGHHGSNTSSGELLLSRTQPEYSIISAGKDNKYGHPHTETMVRLQKYSKEILSTIDRGSITFMSDGRELEVKTKK
jgi:competence protein ComEC